MIKKFSPELNILSNIAQKAIKEGHQHTIEILKSKEKPTQIIGQEIGKILSEGPEKIIKTVEEVSKPVASIASKTVDTLKEKHDPVSEKINDIIQKYPDINPVNIVKNTEKIIKTYTDVTSKGVNEVGVEITKTIVKENASKIIKTTFKDKLIKFINWFKNLFNFSNKS